MTDGTSTVSDTFLIPVYQPSATVLRLALASPLPSGTVGVAYSRTLVSAGGTGPYTYSLYSGALPTGLTLAGGVISGTPTAAGTFVGTVQITDSTASPLTAFGQIKITIVPTASVALLDTIAAAPLTYGVVAAAYGPVTLTATGGTGGPYTWSATNLPPGLTLSTSGVLAGTPTTDGAKGPVAAIVVSDSAMLVTVPQSAMSTAGILRITATTPSPGGGPSNEGVFQVYGPEPQVLAVTNSASLSQGTIAPGEVIAIFGLGMGPDTLTLFDPSVPPIPVLLPAVAPSTAVTINGVPAPIIYTSANPWPGRDRTPIGRRTHGASDSDIRRPLLSGRATVAVATVDPGVYSISSSGHGPGHS